MISMSLCFTVTEQCLWRQAVWICIDCAQQKQQVPFRILDLPSICLNGKLIGNFKYQRAVMR